jgi:hypothetical protein
MAQAPLVPDHDGAPRPEEPQPPLGSWPKFYLLVALVHVAVVAALIVFSNAYRIPVVPR